MSENKKFATEDLIEAIRNNKNQNGYISGRKLAETFGTNVKTVNNRIHRWNDEHPEDKVATLRGAGYKMAAEIVTEKPAMEIANISIFKEQSDISKQNDKTEQLRYDDKRTEEGYPDPTAYAAMPKEEEGPAKAGTLWETQESNGNYIYFAVLKSTPSVAIGYKFYKRDEYVGEPERPFYISSILYGDENLITDLNMPAFKFNKYMIQKVRDLTNMERVELLDEFGDTFGLSYYCKNELEAKDKTIDFLKRTLDRTLKEHKDKDKLASDNQKELEKKLEISRKINGDLRKELSDLKNEKYTYVPNQPSPYPNGYLPYIVLKAERDIYKTFFDRMTSGTNVNASIRVQEEN